MKINKFSIFVGAVYCLLFNYIGLFFVPYVIDLGYELTEKAKLFFDLPWFYFSAFGLLMFGVLIVKDKIIKNPRIILVMNIVLLILCFVLSGKISASVLFQGAVV